MSESGQRTWGTLALVLLLLAGGLLVFQAGTTQAQQKRLWGYVCDSSAPNGVAPDAVATLINAFTGEEITPRNVADDGYYDFIDPAPGYYYARISATGYFTKDTTIERFDGLLTQDFDTLCLDPFPTPRRAYPVVVLDGDFQAVNDEILSSATSSKFAYTTVSLERVGPGGRAYDGPSDTFTLTNGPLVSGETVRFFNTSVGTSLLVRGTDYNVTDSWTPTFNLSNPDAQFALENSVGHLNITYSWASKQANLVNNYLVTVDATKNNVTFFNYTTNYDTGAITLTGNFDFGLDTLVFNYTYALEVPSATVEGWNATQRVDSKTTPGTTPITGLATPLLWGGDFEIVITAANKGTLHYAKAVTAGMTLERQYVSNGTFFRVSLVTGGAEQEPITEGVTGLLYNLDTSVPEDARFIQGTVSANSNTIVFRAANGTYLLIVDAKGFTASREVVNPAVAAISPEGRLVRYLLKSPEEKALTTVSYLTDWNGIRVQRAVRLNNDSAIPGLPNDNVRSAYLQIDLNVQGSDGDGNLSSGERSNFTGWVESIGPRYVTTDDFFDTNGVRYASNGSYVSNVSWDDASGFIYINSTQYYTRKASGATITSGGESYLANFTVELDTNSTVYANNTWVLEVPDDYERTSRHTSAVTGFSPSVTIDPGTNGTAGFRLVLQKSLQGKPSVRVEGPAGQFLETSTTLPWYNVTVNESKAIVFSANLTTVGVGDIANANYTWDFGQGLDGYGIWTTHAFGPSNMPLAGNLHVTQANSLNTSDFQFNITVDSWDPLAAFWSSAENNPVNESVTVRFDGSNSTDRAGSAARSGRIVAWNWDFEGNGVEVPGGANTTYAFPRAGTFNTTLRVVDWVGREDKVNITHTIRDITKPTVQAWTIAKVTPFEEASETDVREDTRYSFNASTTTDNFCDDANMTFAWRIETTAGTNATDSGINVTYLWDTSGTYDVNLTVTDCAGNTAYRLFAQTVQVNLAEHANLQIQDIKATPTSAEEGATVTITVTVKHIAGNLSSSGMTVTAALVDGSKTTAITVTGLKFLTEDDESTDGTLTVNQVKKAQFTYNVGSDVKRRIVKVTVEGADEPDSWVDGANSRSVTITVKPAGWKGLVVPLIFLLFLIGVPVGIFVYRKITSGEWELRRARKDKDEEEDEEEDEKEEKEPKKKRL